MNSKSLTYSELKPQAIALRKEGKTFSEICNQLGPIPKGTLSNWVRHIELSESQKERISKLMTISGSAGRYIGAQKNHQKRMDRIKALTREADLEYKYRIKDPSFLAGLLLYLAEGTKKNEQFQFMNSDPKLVKFMMQWVETNSNQTREDMRFRLYIHELYANERCEQYWASQLDVKPVQFMKTIYKPTGRKRKKNPLYKGCMRLERINSELYWKTMAWRDKFYANMS